MGKRSDTGKHLWTMKAGDILESVVEPEFIIEVIEADLLQDLRQATFIGKVIQFPDNSNRWAIHQTIGSTGRYLKSAFIPSIVGTRDVKLNELLSNIRE
jgi:hypothetical protein